MDNLEILAELRASVEQWRIKAEQIFVRPFEPPAVSIKLKGACAGQANITAWKLTFNPELFLRDKAYYFNQCVPHELAHLLAYRIYGRVLPHGQEWKSIMLKFGVQPKRTHPLDTIGIANRRDKPYTYKCACREHQVTEVLHQRIQYGWKGRPKNYKCSYCHEKVVLTNPLGSDKLRT